jgi:hypothetical protein
MKMNSSSIINIIKSKLEMAERAIGILPDSLQPKVKELQTEVLTSLRDSFDQYLKKESLPKKDGKLQKIELD